MKTNPATNNLISQFSRILDFFKDTSFGQAIFCSTANLPDTLPYIKESLKKMAVLACATLNSISSKISNLGFYRCIPSTTTENTVFRMHLTTHFFKGGRSWFKALIVSLIPVSPPPDNLFATSFPVLQEWLRCV